MRVVDKGLMAMKVAELKEELEARGEGKTGNKAWLRRRLHAALAWASIVRTGPRSKQERAPESGPSVV